MFWVRLSDDLKVTTNYFGAVKVTHPSVHRSKVNPKSCLLHLKQWYSTSWGWMGGAQSLHGPDPARPHLAAWNGEGENLALIQQCNGGGVGPALSWPCGGEWLWPRPTGGREHGLAPTWLGREKRAWHGPMGGEGKGPSPEPATQGRGHGPTLQEDRDKA